MDYIILSMDFVHITPIKEKQQVAFILTMNIDYLRTVVLTDKTSYRHIFRSFTKILHMSGVPNYFYMSQLPLWLLCESKMIKSCKHLSVYGHGMEVHVCLNLSVLIDLD